jgi:hypothetical protein
VPPATPPAAPAAGAPALGPVPAVIPEDVLFESPQANNTDPHQTTPAANSGEIRELVNIGTLSPHTAAIEGVQRWR